MRMPVSRWWIAAGSFATS